MVKCKTTYSNLRLEFKYASTHARVMVAACDAVVIRTWVSCLYLKNDVAHDLSISKNTQ